MILPAMGHPIFAAIYDRAAIAPDDQRRRDPFASARLDAISSEVASRR